MLRPVLARVYRAAVSLLLCSLCALITAGCNDPQSPAPISGFDAHWTGGRLEFALDGATGTTGDFALVATNLQFDPATEVLRADVVLQNRASQAVPGPASVLVYGFVPQAVEILDAACGAPLAQGECAIDYRGMYGDDGSLAAGENSLPIAWRFHVPGGQGFAFRARLAEAAQSTGTISGVVFNDTDGDAVRDAGEVGVGNIQVLIHAAASDSVHTDAQGAYAFAVHEPGIYEVGLLLGTGWRSTTALPLHVTILQLPDSTLSNFTLGDIGIAGSTGGSTIQVEGFAFTDSDRDGLRDEGELGIAGVKITGRACRTSDDKTMDDDDDDDFETRTDASGHYALTLPDCGGPWTIRSASVENHHRTTPKDVVFTVRPSPGGTLQADFGYVPEDISAGYSVRGVIYRDDDGDGIRDLGEPALAGVTVTADGINCSGPALASDRSGESGRYELEGEEVACPLPWLVQRAAIPGAVDTTPASVQLNAPPPLGGRYVVDFGVRFNP